MNAYINADGNGNFTGSVGANAMYANKLCIGSTCISEDNLKILTGEKPVALYHRSGGNADASVPWVHAEAGRHFVKWSSAQSYFTLHT